MRWGTGWKVIAGSGPRMIRMRKCTFCPIPVGGYFNPGEEPGTNKGKVIMYAGGPFVSLLLAALFGVLRFCAFGSVQPEDRLGEILLPVSNFLMFFNFFQFLFTAVPVRYRLVCRGLESDGMQIVHVLKHSKRQDPHES